MTHRPVIEMLQKEYGGSVSMNRHDRRKPEHRIQFTWSVASQVAATFLRRIQPYCIVKADQIEVALAFQAHVDETPYSSKGRSRQPRENSDAIRAYRDTLYDQITALKKQSFLPFTTQ